MPVEALRIFLNFFLETLRIILRFILLMMVVEFSELKHKDEIRRKITAKPYEKGNKDGWRDPE